MQAAGDSQAFAWFRSIGRRFSGAAWAFFNPVRAHQAKRIFGNSERLQGRPYFITLSMDEAPPAMSRPKGGIRL